MIVFVCKRVKLYRMQCDLDIILIITMTTTTTIVNIKMHTKHKNFGFQMCVLTLY